VSKNQKNDSQLYELISLYNYSETLNQSLLSLKQLKLKSLGATKSTKTKSGITTQ